MPLTQQLLLKVPMALLAVIVVGSSVVLAIMTTFFAHFIVPDHKRKKDSYLTTIIFSANAVLYSVLLASVLITSWIGFQNAQSNVQKEANCLVELYRNTAAFLPAIKQETQTLLEEYVKSVINEEWKTLAESKLNPHTIEIGKEIWKMYTSYLPKTATEQAFLQESIRKLYELRECRSERLEDSRTGVYPILWFVLLAGEVVTVFSISLFADNLKSKLATTILFSILVGIFFFTIILFDFPFTGDLTVSPNSFRQVLLNW